MKPLYNSLRNLVFGAAGCFVAFVVYANWEKPSLAESLQLKPIELRVFNLVGAITPYDSLRLSEAMLVQKGITAVCINAAQKTLSVTFYPDQTTEKQLMLRLASVKIQAQKVDFSAVQGPQCPIPMQYIDYFTNAKRALCFRN